MTTARMLQTAALAALLSVGIVAAGHELFENNWLRSLVGRGHDSLQDTSVDALDREIRAALPEGSSRNKVESLLRARHVDYWYPGPQEILAIPRSPKDRNRSAQTGLSIEFHFDKEDELRSIESHSGD